MEIIGKGKDLFLYSLIFCDWGPQANNREINKRNSSYDIHLGASQERSGNPKKWLDVGSSYPILAKSDKL